MTKKEKPAESTIAQNKKARFDYFIEERVEAGVALQGWEVKSMRAGKAQLTAAESRGLELFEDPHKGNCAACHPSSPAADGTPPLFTDFTYDNVGLPRNARIPANADPAFYDLGLCGPERGDLADRRDLCGAFKVPTLRNVARTAPYFHNGGFETLREAVDFYARRDTHPGEWYPQSAGKPRKFDDLPPGLEDAVNTAEIPYDRKPGE